MAPESMQAIKIVSAGKAEIQTVPLPKLRDDYILVKVKYVAINPTDWYEMIMIYLLPHLKLIFLPGSISTTSPTKAPQSAATSAAPLSKWEQESRRTTSLATALRVSLTAPIFRSWKTERSESTLL